MKTKTYHYTECGLDDVVLVGLAKIEDDDGEKVIAIPAIRRLHKAIAKAIIHAPRRMSGKELRFLRTEMGLMQEDLAHLLGCERQAVGRWERGQFKMDAATDALMRFIVAERLGIAFKLKHEEAAQHCKPLKKRAPISITKKDLRPAA